MTQLSRSYESSTAMSASDSSCANRPFTCSRTSWSTHMRRSSAASSRRSVDLSLQYSSAVDTGEQDRLDLSTLSQLSAKGVNGREGSAAGGDNVLRRSVHALLLPAQLDERALHSLHLRVPSGSRSREDVRPAVSSWTTVLLALAGLHPSAPLSVRNNGE